jgi:hypothetical protein
MRKGVEMMQEKEPKLAKRAWCEKEILEGTREQKHPLLPYLYFCCGEHMNFEIERRFGDYGE